MPEEYKSSWADEVELEGGILPPLTEMIDQHGNKVITEYKLNKDDKKIKSVRTYKVTKHVVSKSVARRKKLVKFGDSAKDNVGPNAHTTFVSEDINMQLITSKEEEKSNDAVLDPKSESLGCFTSFAYLLSPFLFQINSPSAVSAAWDISRRTARISTRSRTSRRSWTRSRRSRHQLRKQHRPSRASTFRLSSRMHRRTLEAKLATTRPPFAFPTFPSRRPMPIWRTSRTSSERSRKCIWPRTRTPACAKASLTFTSITRKTLLQRLRRSTVTDTII